MARFRNDTCSVLQSQEFGLLPPGEFEAPGYDPEIHGVIPGCTWLDAPEPEAPEDGSDTSDPPPARSPGKRGKAAQSPEEPQP